ncbi:MAG: D-TA family PLP-dependent enzyme [Tannerellaceae bacterium]|jgi:D-serine deaminase-like pyridoxal phosphate-dependent protein|nr:D-TA family PLP-dependent enzyme [Tannerellaceae bacterium]
MTEWYKIRNIEQIDSPALVVYPERVRDNIRKTLAVSGSVNKLRPHVKTNKMGEVCEMMMQEGITRFKCATIAEAEMLAIAEAPDVLLAYQPTGPKIGRLLKLVQTYRKTLFSCLIDNEVHAEVINKQCKDEAIVLNVFIDLNVGMNRTGVHPEKAFRLVKKIQTLTHLHLAGIHGYDGHIHDKDLIQRQKAADISFGLANDLFEKIQPLFSYPLRMVMGGTPTFPIHVRRPNTECSPGTFVFWDWGYDHEFPDMTYHYAALVISRVISVIDEHHLCIDLGYKSVAAESPLPRVHFLNAPDAVPVAQSEEHLILEVPDSNHYRLGDVFYGVPVHICPTVALYEKAFIIQNGEVATTWAVTARNRFITN